MCCEKSLELTLRACTLHCAEIDHVGPVSQEHNQNLIPCRYPRPRAPESRVFFATANMFAIPSGVLAARMAYIPSNPLTRLVFPIGKRCQDSMETGHHITTLKNRHIYQHSSYKNT